MSEEKVDKRVQRTREALRKSLMQLIDEKGYDSVTIQDIVDRANMGRTTFYLHYESKDDLLLDHHVDFASGLTLRSLSRNELMCESPPVELILFLEKLAADKSIYFAITRGKDAEIIVRGIRQQMVSMLADSLESAFPETDSKFALDLLTNYIVGAQLSLIDWWLGNRNNHSAQAVAEMLHLLQRSAIHNAFEDVI